MSDDRNPGAVAPGTYHHDLVALRLFLCGRPLSTVSPTRSGCGAVGAAARRLCCRATGNGSVGGEGSGRQVVRSRRLRAIPGCRVDGVHRRRSRRSRFRGRNGQRDGAFVDGLYGTGLRLQEWGLCWWPNCRQTIRTASSPPVGWLLRPRNMGAVGGIGCRDGCWWRCSAMSRVSGRMRFAGRRPAVTSDLRVRGWSRGCWAHGGCGFGRSMIGRRMCRWTLWTRRRGGVCWWRPPWVGAGCAVAQRGRVAPRSARLGAHVHHGQ